ncbi:MAG: hypothetical protein ACOCVR_00300 [Myxococcota bacterium]
MRSYLQWKWFVRTLVMLLFVFGSACGPEQPDNDLGGDESGNLDGQQPKGGNEAGGDCLGDDCYTDDGKDECPEGGCDDGAGDDECADGCCDGSCDDDECTDGSCDDGNGDDDECTDGSCDDGDECPDGCCDGSCEDDEPVECDEDICLERLCPQDEQHWCDWRDDCKFEHEISPLARLALYWTGLRPFFKLDLIDDVDVELLAKASYDECYAGVGQPYPEPIGSDEDGVICPEGSQEKRNEAYIWGQKKMDEKIFFGVAPNVHCLVMMSYLQMTTPVETDLYVCELQEASSGRADTRVPTIYVFDKETGELEDISPEMGTPEYMILASTIGLRSAGGLGDVIFLAGPTFDGIAMFAYHAETKEFLGAEVFEEYTDIREWVTAKGHLYTGVEFGDGGAVLKWTGCVEDPFKFEVVGLVPGSAANLAVHEGRLFVSSWPRAEELGLFMSPYLPCEGGLTEANQEQWTKVWSIYDYDPDPLVARTTGGGAMFSHKGFLYWGTMHVPGLAFGMAREFHDIGDDPESLATTYLGTHRAIAIFRGKFFGQEDKEIQQIVYGEKYLPRFDPEIGGYTVARTDFHHNSMDCPAPLWGPSGFGNFFNNYTWAMDVVGKDLYITTMDHSIFAKQGLDHLLDVRFSDIDGMVQPLCADYETIHPFIPEVGADLLRISTCDGHAHAVSMDGIGNPMNYGVRTLEADDESLYLGTANPMNLHPDGGWELLKMTRQDDEQSCVE